jgi:hypothetical protein
MILPFQLHIRSNLELPKFEDDSIIYGPPNVIKLEGSKSITTSTGVSISKCTPDGKIIISLISPYCDKIRITNNEFSSYYNKIFEVELHNVTNEFIRIDPFDHLFKYTYVPNQKKTITKKVLDVVEVVSEVVETAAAVVGHPEVAAVADAIEHIIELIEEKMEVDTPIDTPVEMPIDTPVVDASVDTPVVDASVDTPVEMSIVETPVLEKPVKTIRKTKKRASKVKI